MSDAVIEDLLNLRRVIERRDAEIGALRQRNAYLESYVDGNDLRSDYPTATAMRRELERANSMLTHGGILKAQEIHNQMIAERDKRIAELEEELAQWQHAAGS